MMRMMTTRMKASAPTYNMYMCMYMYAHLEGEGAERVAEGEAPSCGS